VEPRRRVAVIAALVAVAVSATVFAAARGDDHDVAVSSAGGEITTSSSALSDATSTTGTSETTAASVTTVASPPQGTPSTTIATTTTVAGGPRPGGGASVHRCAQVDSLTADGLSAQVCQEGPSVAGSPTTLHITASDGDAKVDNDCRSPDVEWGDEPSVRCMIACQMSDSRSDPSSIDVKRDHTYSHPGTYHVAVTVESNCGSGPYGESHTLELDLVLSDPNTPPDGTG